MKFKNVKYLDSSFRFSNGDVCVENGRFTSVGTGEELDCKGLLMLPGLVDIHTHGAVGFDAMDMDVHGLEKISEFMGKNGTTTFLPTVMTEKREVLFESCKIISALADKDPCGAKIGGIYMEGPYFSMKYRGAQNPNYIRLPNVEEFEEIYMASKETIRVVSLAPECEGAEEFIKSVSKRVRVSMGHTDADYATAKKAIEWGVSNLTHSFNAMRGLHHREPGAIGAAIESNITCECICDGLHVHPVMVKILYDSIGEDRFVMVSDSIRPAGLSDGEYTSGGLDVIMNGGKITLKDGTIAGSGANLFYGVKKAVEFGIPLEKAVKAASLNPARAAGLDSFCGIIKEGRSADFLLTDEALNLKAVYVIGKKIG